MKKTSSISVAIIFSLQVHAQNTDTIRLSQFTLCELTIDALRQKDTNLHKANVIEMDLCADGFVEDARFENRIGYETALYPGIIFQKDNLDTNTIAKIHLNRKFKGYMPDGSYVDMATLKASDILEKYDSLNAWTSRGCSDYWSIKDNDQIYYYVKINKELKPQYPVNEEYYKQQPIEGIDIIANCYRYNKARQSEPKPLIILEGKEITEDDMKKIFPEDVDSIIVLKNENAISKYGDKGKNGVVEIYLKKK